MDVFSKIFGSKKGVPPDPQQAIQKLRDIEEMLEKKTTFLEGKIAQELDTAKKNGTRNKRGWCSFQNENWCWWCENIISHWSMSVRSSKQNIPSKLAKPFGQNKFDVVQSRLCNVFTWVSWGNWILNIWIHSHLTSLFLCLIKWRWFGAISHSAFFHFVYFLAVRSQNVLEDVLFFPV